MVYEVNMLYKKYIIKLLSLSILMLVSCNLSAHQPDLSNIIISETGNGQVILQINSSLTAFQQEVNFINGPGAYKSPEEFQELVIKHFNTSFSMVVNGENTLQLKNPQVFLGHETKLVAEIIGLPETINAIQLKNELFKDIYHNQSIVIFLLDGFPKTKYTLEPDNNHEINIALENDTWKTIKVENAGFNFKYTSYFAIILLAGLVLYFVRRKKSIP